jgi:hypothetical protein
MRFPPEKVEEMLQVLMRKQAVLYLSTDKIKKAGPFLILPFRHSNDKVLAIS